MVCSYWLFSSHLGLTTWPAAGRLPRPLHRDPWWAGARKGAKCKIPCLYSVSIFIVLSLVPLLLFSPTFYYLGFRELLVLVFPISCPICLQFSFSVLAPCGSAFSSLHLPFPSSPRLFSGLCFHASVATPMPVTPSFIRYTLSPAATWLFCRFYC